MESNQNKSNQGLTEEYVKQTDTQLCSIQDFRTSMQTANEVIKSLIQKVIALDNEKILHQKILSQNIQFFSDTYHIMQEIPQIMPDHVWTNDFEGYSMKSSIQERKIKFKETMQCLKASNIISDVRNSTCRRMLKFQHKKARQTLKRTQSFVGLPITAQSGKSSNQSNDGLFRQFNGLSKDATPTTIQRSQELTLRLIFKKLIANPSKRQLIPLKNNFLEEPTAFEEMKRQQLRQFLQIRKKKRADDEKEQIQRKNQNANKRQKFSVKAASTCQGFGKQLTLLRCKTVQNQIRNKSFRRNTCNDESKIVLNNRNKENKENQETKNNKNNKNIRKYKQIEKFHQLFDNKLAVQLDQRAKTPIKAQQFSNRTNLCNSREQKLLSIDKYKKMSTQSNQIFPDQKNSKISKQNKILSRVPNQCSGIIAGKSLFLNSFKIAKSKIRNHNKEREEAKDSKQKVGKLNNGQSNFAQRMQIGKTSRIVVFNSGQLQQLKSCD